MHFTYDAAGHDKFGRANLPNIPFPEQKRGSIAPAYKNCATVVISFVFSLWVIDEFFSYLSTIYCSHDEKIDNCFGYITVINASPDHAFNT